MGVSPLRHTMKNVVAWDVYTHRTFGAPGEKRHVVLFVDDYKNGGENDLNYLLWSAENSPGGVDGRSKTIHVKPLYAEDTEAKKLLAKARNMLSHPSSWHEKDDHSQKRRELSEKIATYLANC